MTDDEKKTWQHPGWARSPLGALSGALAGLASLGVAELVSAAVRPQAGPVVAVGGAAIDRTPAAVKDWAIRHFGTDDKLVLQLGILVMLALFALTLGIFALRFRRTGAAGVLLFGAVGASAATARPDSTSLSDALPSVVGGIAGAVVLYVLLGYLTPLIPGPSAERAAGEQESPVSGAGWDRRGFVIAATAAAAASAGAGVIGRTLNGASGQNAVASRNKLVLPRPASPAAAVPRGAQVRIPGISAFTTPNGDFYRVDTALVVPKVNATTWTLRIHGKGVTRPVTLTFDDLLRRELTERDITLTCVSNEVGGPYVGNARWIGVRLADLLAECGGGSRRRRAAPPTSWWPARWTG